MAPKATAMKVRSFRVPEFDAHGVFGYWRSAAHRFFRATGPAISLALAAHKATAIGSVHPMAGDDFYGRIQR